jgi:hypothetical protein
MLWVMLRFKVSKADMAIFGAAWILPSAMWLHSSNLGLAPLVYSSIFAIACRMIAARFSPLPVLQRHAAAAAHLPRPV